MTRDPMARGECPTDLLAKQRRQELSSTERRSLEAHLLGCRSCRAWAQIGQDFDEQPGYQGDAAVLGRIAARIDPTRLWVPPKRHPSWRRWTPATIAICSAAAAAGWTGHRWIQRPPSPVVDRAVATASPAHLAIPSARLVEPAVPSELAPQTKPTRAIANPVIVQTKASTDGTDNALALYREANRARRDGHLTRAMAVFRQLQRAFPHSAEAQLSNVALGGALLDSGSTREALQQFERYLSVSGPKPLAAEAQYGRARALRALGDVARERTAWRQLLDDFPRSPYAATAKRRLEAIE